MELNMKIAIIVLFVVVSIQVYSQDILNQNDLSIPKCKVETTLINENILNCKNTTDILHILMDSNYCDLTDSKSRTVSVDSLSRLVKNVITDTIFSQYIFDTLKIFTYPKWVNSIPSLKNVVASTDVTIFPKYYQPKKIYVGSYENVLSEGHEFHKVWIDSTNDTKTLRYITFSFNYDANSRSWKLSNVYIPNIDFYRKD